MSIPSHRLSKATVTLVDANGNPIKNKDVNFKLSNPEFLFGCGAFDFISLLSEIPDYPADNDATHPGKEFYQDRVDKWLKVFNYGTLPFYWGGYEPEEGNPKFDSRMKAAKYMKEHNATAKGHPLCWHTACADWLLKYDNKTIMDKQLDRIHRDVTQFKGVIDMWDVINETVIMPEFDRYDNAITRICNAYGRTTLIKEVFTAAHEANPDALLLINDFNLSDKYRDVIDECLEAGVPIGAIGLQTHQHQGYRGLDWLNEVLDRFSVFNLPLHFTENTLVSGHIMPSHIVDLNDYQIPDWPTTAEGEERQCREWKEMYERLFEHPLVGALTGWDFADGAWLGAPSGLIRKDSSEKPSYFMIQELAKKTWATDVTLTTDENGCVNLEGVRGEYLVSSGNTCAKLNLSKDVIGANITLK
ncbi:MAG: endo-1,4-beta-xylanase [Lachnospiraceae bacterium]|nr:endo-1,4-beta-xylanase [Lachnospiraceae bacterium]